MFASLMNFKCYHTGETLGYYKALSFLRSQKAQSYTTTYISSIPGV